MASEVPKFGAWEGGAENFTICFDGARNKKHNGQKINPNYPEENPGIQQNLGSTQTVPSQNKPDKQRKETKVPHFGDWESGENINYTGRFENPRKTEKGGPQVVKNEPHMNRDMPLRAQPQARTQTAKPETREGRSIVPSFGHWESGGGDYTEAFDKLDKKHDPKSKAPRDVGPPYQGGPTTVPEFGAWDEGNAVQYTTDFENLNRPKNLRPGVGVKSTEPQLNRDVGDNGRPHPETKPRVDRDVVDKGQPHPETKPKVGPKEDGLINASKGSTYSVPDSEHAPRQGKPSSKARLPVDQKERLQPRTGPTRGNPAVTPHGHDLGWATVPTFGEWNDDPTKAEGYTGVFVRAKEGRKILLDNTVPPSYLRETRHTDKPQPSCCSIL